MLTYYKLEVRFSKETTTLTLAWDPFQLSQLVPYDPTIPLFASLMCEPKSPYLMRAEDIELAYERETIVELLEWKDPSIRTTTIIIIGLGQRETCPLTLFGEADKD